MIWATGRMDGLWTIDRLDIAFTKGSALSHSALRMLIRRSRGPVTYDELLLPEEAPGGCDRRGDLSECNQHSI
jgi:hypothetical protein